MSDTETLDTRAETIVTRSAPFEPLCVLETKSACRLLGLYLAILNMVAAVICLAMHELGHAIANESIGIPTCGFYVSPAFGRTFSLYPLGASVAMGFESLAGIALTQVSGYALYAWMKRRTRTRWFFAESFLCVFAIALLVGDTIYMPLGLAFHFGDPHEAVRNFGIPSVVLWAVAFAQMYVTKYLSERIAIRWFRAYFVVRIPRAGSMVFNWIFLSMIALCLLYAAYAVCFT